YVFIFFFFSSRRRHTRSDRDWSSDVCSSDLVHEYYNPNKIRIEWLMAGGTSDETSSNRNALSLACVRSSQARAPGPQSCQGTGKIGRASCRERVYMSVVEGSGKRERNK